MISIHLPMTMEGLLAPLDRAINAASNVGLGNIEYSIKSSSRPFLTIHIDERQYVIVIDDYSSFPYVDLIDRKIYQGQLIYFRYCESTQPSFRYLSYPSAENQDVFVDITASGKPCDVAEQWHISDEERSYRFSSSSSFDFSSWTCQMGHLAWFVAGLIYNFSIHDSLLIAHLGRDVSRETWVGSSTDFLVPCDDSRNLYNVETSEEYAAFPMVDLSKFKLYPVIENEVLINALIHSGVKTIQLRVKNPQSDYEKMLSRINEKAKLKGVQLFINDYWQLALKHRTYGVHLGQEDLLTADLERLRSGGIRLGISTHSYFEVLIALAIRPSYIALGHIFPTKTKTMPSLPQGLIRLRLYHSFIKKSCSELGFNIPTCAIGGINTENAASVIETGIDSIAVVTALTEANNLDETLAVFESCFSLVEGEINA